MMKMRSTANLTRAERELMATKPRRYAKVQAEISRLTNWQRNQWQRHAGGEPGSLPEQGTKEAAGLGGASPWA